LAIYFPKCTKKHPINECPLDLIDVCGICEENHPTNKCPSFSGLKDTFRGAKENVESLYFINQRRHGAPRPFQTCLNFNPAQNFGAYNTQISSQQWYNPNPSPWKNTNPWKYQEPPIPPPYQSFPSMPQNQNPQWSQPLQGWRPQNFQQPTLMHPPPQPNNTIQNSVPPKQPQLPAQPAPNLNNKQVQPVYNNETTYQTYSLEVQEINLRSGKVLKQQPKLIKDVESEKDDVILPQPQTPPYPERLNEKKTYTSKEK
jgi:hypothetical protein